MDKTCHAQLLCDAAASGAGRKKIMIPDDEAEFSFAQAGTEGERLVGFSGVL